MSDFWLGVWLGLAVWKFIQAALRASAVGAVATITLKSVVAELVLMALFLLLAVFAFIGVWP